MSNQVVLALSSLLSSVLLNLGSSAWNESYAQLPVASNKVSSQDAHKFLTQFEALDESQKQAWKMFTDGQTGQIKHLPGAVENWVQAANKKEACRVYAATFVEPGKAPWWEKAGNYIHWDGACIDGYAAGIGREFTFEEGQLSAWLADYDGVKKAPQYYLVTHYDKQTIEFKVAAHPLYVSLQYVLNTSGDPKSDKSAKQLAVNYSVLNMAENRLYRKEGAVGIDQVSKSMMLPNKNSYAVVQNISPVTQFSYHTSVNSLWQRMGYSVVYANSGLEAKTMQLFNATPEKTQETNLPSTYIDHLKTVNAKIDRNLAAGEQVLQRTFEVLAKYRTRVCQGVVKVDFMDSLQYGRLCLENGELSVFDDWVATSLKKQQLAHEQLKKEILRRKELLAKAPANVSANVAANVSANATNNNHANKMTANLQQFVNDIEKSARSISDFSRSSMEAKPHWAGLSSDMKNCAIVANLVQCKLP